MLDLVFGGNTTFTKDTTLYLALYTVAWTSANGGGTEVSTSVWTNYARLAITNNDSNWTASDAFSKANNAAFEWAAATISGTAPVIVGWALMTASSGGTLRAFGTVSPSQTVSNGNVFRFAAGDLQLQISNTN